MNTNKTRTNKQARVATTPKSTPAKSRVPAPALVADPIAEMQAQIATLTRAVNLLLVAVDPDTVGTTAHAPAQAKSPARVAAPKTAKKRDPNADAKKAAHLAKREAYTQARDAWASRDWDTCVKMAAAEIRKNRKAGVTNANIAGDCVRRYLTSTSNQGFMAARKNAGVAYADAMGQLEKASK